MAKTRMSDKERFERDERAKRLVLARKKAGFGGVKSASSAFGWNVNNYKAHEAGQNGFSSEQAKVYANAFGVSLNWLWFGIGKPEDEDTASPHVTDVPLISMVSAGQLVDHEGVVDLSAFPTVPAIDLPEGEWIALRVEGDSMNKISPPGSVVFTNIRDRRLVHNACYVVADETGAATYKRYRIGDAPPFQPASYHDVEPPALHGAIRIIGRVRRSVIDL